MLLKSLLPNYFQFITLRFFKLFSTYFLPRIFLNISLKRDSRLKHTPTLSVKFEFLMSDLFAGLEQVSHNHCLVAASVTESTSP